MHRFLGWDLDPVARVLRVQGVRASIGGRAFDLLLMLIERQGTVVTKSELLERVWPGLVVEENNVSVQVAALRKVLGAAAISTVAAVGYRLSAQPLAASPAAPAPESAPVPTAAPGPGRASESVSIGWTPVARQPSLLGRAGDLADLLECLRNESLVSIIGTGGVGKTSLARAVLAQVRAADGHGGGDTHWIDLAPLRQGAQFIPLLAKTLGVEIVGADDAAAALLQALSQMRCLIVLDNCEHLLADVAAFVGTALLQPGQVRWLATSLEPLHLSDERVYRLDPLEVPEHGADMQQAMACGSLQLLAQRAAAADRRFQLGPANLATAIELCRQLDGLPLAIEMAASRVAAWGLQGVHDQLDQRLRVLAGARGAPPRHLNLRATFDWSYGLLSAQEQQIFRRLQPFVGGFRTEMAQLLVRKGVESGDELDPWDALDGLSALIEKSLVQRGAGPAHRNSLLQSARDYAAERLAEVGETAALRLRHAQVIAEWFDTAQADCMELRDERWVALYLPERANVLQALNWVCQLDEPDLLARLVAALAQLDSFVQAPAEVLQLGVPMDVLERAQTPLRAVACIEFSWAHYTEGSRAQGTRLALSALEDFRAIGDRAGEHRALAQLVRLYESRQMREEARQAFALLQQIDPAQVPLRQQLWVPITAGLMYGDEQSIARLRELEGMAERAGYATLSATCRVRITDMLLIEGRFDEAADTAQRFLDAGEIRPRMKGLILCNRALALVQLGRHAQAWEAARAALRVLPSASHVIIDTCALAAARDDRCPDAAMMAGYARRIERERDERPDPAEQAVISETRERLLRSLGPTRLEELMRMGAAMAMADVLAIAMPE